MADPTPLFRPESPAVLFKAFTALARKGFGSVLAMLVGTLWPIAGSAAAGIAGWV